MIYIVLRHAYMVKDQSFCRGLSELQLTLATWMDTWQILASVHRLQSKLILQVANGKYQLTSVK